MIQINQHFHFWFVEELVILATQGHQVFYLEDPKNGTNWKFFQVVQNKRIRDVPKVEDVENEQPNVLEVIVGHHVDEHIEDNTLCRPDIDSAVVGRTVVRHVVNDFIDDDDKQLSQKSGSSEEE